MTTFRTIAFCAVVLLASPPACDSGGGGGAADTTTPDTTTETSEEGDQEPACTEDETTPLLTCVETNCAESNDLTGCVMDTRPHSREWARHTSTTSPTSDGE